MTKPPAPCQRDRKAVGVLRAEGFHIVKPAMGSRLMVASAPGQGRV